MEQKLQVGIITATHGLKGEVKVYPTTDDPGRFRRLKKVILDNGKECPWITEIESVKYFKQFVILKFKGLDDIEQVEKYRKASLYVTRDNAVRLKRTSFYCRPYRYEGGKGGWFPFGNASGCYNHRGE